MNSSDPPDQAARPQGKSSRKKNALFLLIDALRFDTMSDPVARKFLFPNLARIADQGEVKRVVTNAQSTQFVMPSLFSLTYPLDYGGYNTGIRLRPRSFVEVLQAAGWQTHKLVTVNQIGVHHGYERGFDTVRTGTDFRVVLEHNLDRTLSHEIDLWKRGEKTEAEVVKVFEVEFGLVLDQLEKIWKSFDQSLWTPRLKSINGRVARGITAERRLLLDDPLVVLNKVANLSGAAYWRFLGARKINRLKRFFWHGIGLVRHHTRNWIAARVFPPYFFQTHYPLVMPDIVDKLCEFAKSMRGRRWFSYMHFMDVHDCRLFNRPLVVVARWRFLPRWLIGRNRGLTRRRFAYDSALMAADVGPGKLLDVLENSGQIKDLVIIVTGDHANQYADTPRLGKGAVESRTHYEDIEVPMILVGGRKLPDDCGLIDSMGVTATLLDVLGVEGDPSFKGVSAYDGGRTAIISEHCGHGAVDLARKDLFFTVTTATHRMMTTLSGSKLRPRQLYDIQADPREVRDLIDDPASGPVISELLGHIHRERAELMALRGIEPASPSSDG